MRLFSCTEVALWNTTRAMWQNLRLFAMNAKIALLSDWLGVAGRCQKSLKQTFWLVGRRNTWHIWPPGRRHGNYNSHADNVIALRQDKVFKWDCRLKIKFCSCFCIRTIVYFFSSKIALFRSFFLADDTRNTLYLFFKASFVSRCEQLINFKYSRIFKILDSQDHNPSRYCPYWNAKNNQSRLPTKSRVKNCHKYWCIRWRFTLKRSNALKKYM